MRLRVADSSLAQVARELRVAATTVTSVSQGTRRSRRIEAAIAIKLGLSAKELWPERYWGRGCDRSDEAITESEHSGGDWPRYHRT